MRRTARLVRVLSVAVLFSALDPPAAHAEWNPAGEPVPAVNCDSPLVSCLDAAGGLFTFWQVVDPATPPVVRIVGHRRMPDGSDAPGWPSAGRTIAGIETDHGLPGVLAACADGAGGAFLCFRENRFVSSWVPTQSRLFRMLPAGSLDPAWPDSGLALGRPEFTGAAALAPDGAGGAFVGLLDDLRYRFRVSGGVTLARISELRLARVAASGELAPDWPAEGVLVRGVAPESLFFYPEWSFALLSDGAGGVAMAWADSSGGSTDTRLWRYGANGAAAGGWPVDGVTVTPTVLHAGPMLVADGSGGLYAAWTDSLSPPAAYGSPRLLHLQGSGAPVAGWPAGGLKPADTDMTWHWMGGIAPDGAGGVYAQMSEVGTASQRVRLVRRTGEAAIPAGWTAQGLAVEFASTAYPAVNEPVADAQGGVHMVMGMGPMPSLNDVRIGRDGAVLPGWSLESPRTLPLSGPWWTADVLGDGQGTVDLVGRLQDGLTCQQLAWQLGTREQGIAGVPSPAAARIALAAGPNPSAGPVELVFTLPRDGDAVVEVYEIGGRRVRAWRAAMSAGTHRLAWDGRSDDGDAVAPGLYFVLVGLGDATVSRRVAIVR